MGRSVLILFSYVAFFSFESQVFSQTSTRTETVSGNTTWSSLFGSTNTSTLDITIRSNIDDVKTLTLTIDVAQVNCRSLTIGSRDEDCDEGRLNVVFNGNTVNVATDFTLYHADEDDENRTVNIGSGTLVVGRDLIAKNKTKDTKNTISVSSGTIKVGGQWTMGTGSCFEGGAGLVEFTGSTEQTLPNIPYANLSCSGSGTKNFPKLSTKSYPTFDDNPIWRIRDLKIYEGTTICLSYPSGPVKPVSDRDCEYRADRIFLWEGDRLVRQEQGSYRGSGSRVISPDPYGSATQKAALGSCNGVFTSTLAALPVALASYTAKLTPDNKVSLGWVTSTERFNKGFRIERQAGNENSKFEQIGFVASKAKDGNSQNSLAYNFIDAAPKLGASSFYRLVQEDLDRKLTYSEVRVVKLNGQSVSMVFPNPSNGAVNISRTADGKKMNVQVIDLFGRIISQASNITDANYMLTIPQPGVYTIKMISPETGEQSIQRVVVQK